jgi:hypothetical protein
MLLRQSLMALLLVAGTSVRMPVLTTLRRPLPARMVIHDDTASSSDTEWAKVNMDLDKAIGRVQSTKWEQWTHAWTVDSLSEYLEKSKKTITTAKKLTQAQVAEANARAEAVRRMAEHEAAEAAKAIASRDRAVAKAKEAEEAAAAAKADAAAARDSDRVSEEANKAAREELERAGQAAEEASARAASAEATAAKAAQGKRGLALDRAPTAATPFR